jgi:ribosomal protein S18 acetylase RimI-like enzyme
MKIIVERVHSAEEYLQYWTTAMANVHWFKKRRLFDYNRDEMVEEIAEEFGKPGSVYLVAKSQDTEELLGVLEVKTKRNAGVFGRWEPAVRLEHRNSGAGEVLIKEAFSWLRENHIPKVTCMLRCPYSRSETGRWHMTLYRKCGFAQKGYVGVMLLADLRKVMMTMQKVENLRVVDGDDLPLERYTEFTRRAYMSTPEDKAVHGRDPYVSGPDENMRILRAVKEGDFGFSPSKCWKVAMLEDEVAGFIIAFMPKSKYRPSHGVIAELGVFPEFRRKSIAYSLIAEMHECFKNHGSRYSYVGTPRANEAAIRLYRKAGYRPVFEIVNFEKVL